MADITRRSFLKLGGVGAVAAGAVAIPKLDFGDYPNKGQRVRLWGGQKAHCENCDEQIAVANVPAIYSGRDGRGEHIFLLETPLFCSKCRSRLGQYIGEIDKFIKL